MTMTNENLNIAEAHEFLVANGVNWRLGTVRQYVFFGRIPSEKIMSSRVIKRADLERVIADYRAKKIS